jgi:hypothetical protein
MDGETLSLMGQLGSMALAVVIGRFVLKSSAQIRLVSLAGAVGAMVSHMMYDGQGAFLLLLFAPIIYFISVAGRRDLNGQKPI